MVSQLLFLLLSAVALGGGSMLLLRRDPIDGALALVLTMVALGGLYLQLAAPVIAALQVIVYAGAIMVLFLFVTMFVRRSEEQGPLYRNRPMFAIAFLVAALLFGLLASQMLHSEMLSVAVAGTGADLRAIAEHIFSAYLFPFELVSALLLVAMVGVVVLARRGEEA
jgi:NADH-quinone oxidoreductase subunit J